MTKKRKTKPQRRRPLTPVAVTSPGEPLPLVTRERLLRRSSVARGERITEAEIERDDARARAHEAEIQLEPYRRGRGLRVHGEKVRDRAVLAAKVWAAVERERKLRPHNTHSAACWDVNVQCGHKRKSSWAHQLWREHEKARTKG